MVYRWKDSYIASIEVLQKLYPEYNAMDLKSANLNHNDNSFPDSCFDELFEQTTSLHSPVGPRIDYSRTKWQFLGIIEITFPVIKNLNLKLAIAFFLNCPLL